MTASTPCATGGWRGFLGSLLPVGFQPRKTVQRRLTVWLALDVLHQAGRQWAEWYLLHGINGDQVLLDGSKKSAKKGRTNRAFPGGPGQRDCLAARGRWSGHALGSSRDRSQCQRRWPHRGAACLVGRAAAGSGPTPGGTRCPRFAHGSSRRRRRQPPQSGACRGRRLDRSATCPIRHQFDLPPAGRDGVGQHSVGVPSASQPNQKPN